MRKTDKKYSLLISPVFILGLVCLFLNDHLLKYHYPNWLTGKLSDFLGLLLFGLFWTVIVPKRQNVVLLVIGLGFVYWKLPISDRLIDFINYHLPIEIGRIVDYSDLVSLAVLPLVKFIYASYNYSHTKLKLIHLIPAMIVFSATSYVHPMVVDSDKLVIATISDKDYSFNVKYEDYQMFLDNYTLFNDSNSIAYFNRVEITNDTLFLYYRYKVYFPLDSINTDYFYANAKFLEKKRGKNKITFDLISAEATVREDNVQKDLRGLLSGLKHHLRYIAEGHQN